MGLFRKKNNDAEHLRMMQEQLVAMRERLDQSDAANSQLEDRLGHLDAENRRLTDQVGEVEVQVVTVQGQVGAVEGRVGDVATKIGTVEGHVGKVATHVGDVIAKVGTVESHIVSVDDVEQRLADQVAALSATVEEQRIHLADLVLVAKDTAEKAAAAAAETDQTPIRHVDDELRIQVGQIAEKMAALDGRVAQISVELTNQLTELGNELDSVHERGGDTASIEHRLEAITTGQTRLANEQARYEIQFRNDLAELVERFRRPGTA